jgi:8-oxo-dGTP pyrophosphatase MutT (NUDIX family)
LVQGELFGVTDLRLTLEERRLVFENERFRAYSDTLSYGKGVACNYLTIAPKVNVAKVTGVAVLPIVEDKVGLLRIYRHPVGGFSWEIPRGFVDKDGVKKSALRELWEETGLICKASSLKPLATVTPDSGVLAAKVQLFVALNCQRSVGFKPRELGHKSFRLFDFKEVSRMIKQGEIEDSYTIIAYYTWVCERKLLGAALG